MFSVEDLRTHVAARIEAHRVEVFPSPHLVVPKFLPEAVFAEVLRLNPFAKNTGKPWISTDEMKKVRQETTPYDRRTQIDIESESFDTTEEGRQFWARFSEAFVGDDWLAKQFYKAYAPFFDLRFGEIVREPSFFQRLRHKLIVQRHRPGFFIGPHTDSPHRVFTAIFAWAQRAGDEEFGTDFVRPKDPLTRCWGDLHHKPEDFTSATVAPYAPNSFLVFFKTRHSFHAVRTLPQGIPGERFGAQIAYYEPSGGLFKDLSRPDLMENRTSKPIFRLDAFGRTLQLMRK